MSDEFAYFVTPYEGPEQIARVDGYVRARATDGIFLRDIKTRVAAETTATPLIDELFSNDPFWPRIRDDIRVPKDSVVIQIGIVSKPQALGISSRMVEDLEMSRLLFSKDLEATVQA